MKPTILMVPRMPDALVERLHESYVVLGPMEHSTIDALPAGASEAEALLTMGSLSTDATLIDALPKLKLICCYGTGIEGVDRVHAKARGIVLGNAGEANAASVAEFAMGLVLATARRIPQADRYVRTGRWQGNSVQSMPSVPGLAGRRLGIYGLGAIGSRIARRAEAFEMEVGYHNRSRRSEMPYLYHDTLLGLAAWADILVVSARASVENRHAVDAAVLKALGPSGHLVNISRGSAIDEAALIAALADKTIAGAGLDVFETEPHAPDALTAFPNVVLTPHIGGHTLESHVAMQNCVMANLEAFFAGKPLAYPVT